ncbi:MAG: 30S ribosomal protein S8, partial [Candidatus Kapaibacterium sp.]
NGAPAIREVKRISRPGIRRYAGAEELPKVYNGLGIAIVSTSQGLMTDKQARQKGIGGEVLCTLW